MNQDLPDKKPSEPSPEKKRSSGKIPAVPAPEGFVDIPEESQPEKLEDVVSKPKIEAVDTLPIVMEGVDTGVFHGPVYENKICRIHPDGSVELRYLSKKKMLKYLINPAITLGVPYIDGIVRKIVSGAVPYDKKTFRLDQNTAERLRIGPAVYSALIRSLMQDKKFKKYVAGKRKIIGTVKDKRRVVQDLAEMAFNPGYKPDIKDWVDDTKRSRLAYAASPMLNAAALSAYMWIFGRPVVQDWLEKNFEFLPKDIKLAANAAASIFGAQPANRLEDDAADLRAQTQALETETFMMPELGDNMERITSQIEVIGRDFNSLEHKIEMFGDTWNAVSADIVSNIAGFTFAPLRWSSDLLGLRQQYDMLSNYIVGSWTAEAIEWHRSWDHNLTDPIANAVRSNHPDYSDRQVQAEVNRILDNAKEYAREHGNTSSAADFIQQQIRSKEGQERSQYNRERENARQQHEQEQNAMAQEYVSSLDQAREYLHAIVDTHTEQLAAGNLLHGFYEELTHVISEYRRTQDREVLREFADQYRSGTFDEALSQLRSYDAEQAAGWESAADNLEHLAEQVETIQGDVERAADAYHTAGSLRAQLRNFESYEGVPELIEEVGDLEDELKDAYDDANQRESFIAVAPPGGLRYPDEKDSPIVTMGFFSSLIVSGTIALFAIPSGILGIYRIMKKEKK